MRKFITALLIISTIVSCSENTGYKEKSSVTDELKLIDSPADSVSAEPYLFTDKNGLVYLSWIERKADSSFLKFSTLINEKWSIPVVIAAGVDWFVNWADYPMIVSDGEGNMMAHYLEKSAKGVFTYDIKMLASSDKGKTWSKPFILHGDGKKAEHGFVSMTPYKGDFFVSWLDGRNTVSDDPKADAHGHHGQMSLRAAIIDVNGKKLQEWELDNRVCDCCQTSAAITSKGPVVIYRDRSDEEIRDISIARLEKDVWSKPNAIYDDQWEIKGCPVNGPQVAALDNNVAIAWFSSPENQSQVKIIFSEDSGANFGKPIRIDKDTTIGRVDLVLLDKNNVAISWMEGSKIKMANVNKDGTVSEPIIIASSSVSRSSGFPQMVKSGKKLIFAWTNIEIKSINVASLTL